jgi:predicted DNA-binding transcriptional regulator YafY
MPIILRSVTFDRAIACREPYGINPILKIGDRVNTCGIIAVDKDVGSIYYSLMRMAKYDRLLFILNLLRTRRNLNAAKIADECGVTERTIYRDVISISEANVPIYYDRGYKYATDNFLPPLNFNIDEYLTLISIMESSPLYKSGHSRKQIKSIKTKIEACLSQNVRQEKSFALSPTRIDIKSTDSGDDKDKYYSIIEEGIKTRRTVSLIYDSIESGLTTREIEPYFMIFIERAFYFVGYCYLRKDLRTFRIDRIRGITLTGKTFVPRKGIDAADYFRNSWGVFSGETVCVRAILSGKAARIVQMGKHHASEEIIRLDDGKIEYRVTVSGIDEICRWLLGFGGDVSVIEPEELKNEITKRAGDILQNYI